MVISPQRLISPIKFPRYSFFSLFSHFHTLQQLESNHQINSANPNPNPNPNPNLDESKILSELSNILPIRSVEIPNRYCPNLISPPIENQTLVKRSPDGFLPLEDKLRGVFIQKLKGKVLIENALDRALGDAEIDVEVVSRVLNWGNLGGGAMVVFFDWAVKRGGVGKDVEVYNVVLKALGRRKYFEFMVGKLREMSVEGVCPNNDTLMIVMDSFVRARRISWAVELFKELEEFGMKCDTEAFNVLLRCLCKRSHVGMANSLLNTMKGKVVIECVSYNVVIGGWAGLGKVSEMERCLKAMVEDGFCADCRTYSSVIEGLGRAGKVEGAVEIFKSMEGEGCQPDLGVYNAMISNFVCDSNFDECMRYYEEMLRKNCQPNLDTYTTIISGLLKARKVADALELFDKMLLQGVVPTTGVLTRFLEALCSFGPPHAAMMLFKSARKFGCKISLTGYKLLLMRLSRFGKCGMVLKLWNEMQECGYSTDSDVYEYVVNGLCNNGQLDTAVFVMEEAIHKGICPSRLICSKLNNKLLASNKAQTAYKLFLKIRQARVSENARRYWRSNGWHF